MAGGAMKYRHLSRSSAHRQALLRNLVTSLFEHESISTTWPKAKEAQRLAEKLVTLAKKNTSASRRRAHQIFYRPLDLVPKLFGPIRERYLSRPGGYTRVLRIEPLKEDHAPSAVLELVDGPADLRFALTAQTIARDRALNRDSNPITELNLRKVTRFRAGGMDDLEELVARLSSMDVRERETGKAPRGRRKLRPKRRVYKKMKGPHRHSRGPQFYQKQGARTLFDPEAD